MKLQELRALFVLAGIQAEQIYDLMEGSDIQNPFWGVRTKFGDLTLGIQKNDNVCICWKETEFRQFITEDEVKQTKTYVHATSYPKALEYLTTFRRAMEVYLELKENEYAQWSRQNVLRSSVGHGSSGNERRAEAA